MGVHLDLESPNFLSLDRFYNEQKICFLYKQSSKTKDAAINTTIGITTKQILPNTEIGNTDRYLLLTIIKNPNIDGLIKLLS